MPMHRQYQAYWLVGGTGACINVAFRQPRCLTEATSLVMQATVQTATASTRLQNQTRG